MTTEHDLFPNDMICPDVRASLPADYSIRPLRKSDYDSGFLETLTELSEVGDLSRHEFDKGFDIMKQAGIYYILVICDNTIDKVVATGTLVIEQKL